MSYAALNTQFSLQSPPPRNVFSTIRNIDGRAWFPDFTMEANPTGSLQNFIKILFYPTLHKSTFVQLKLLSVLTAIIGVSILLIILRRLYEKSFWLFRLVRRSNGTLIVPNAITAFVAVESTFAILLIALCWEVIAWFQQGRSPKYMILWIGLTWLPLILGAWCTTVGIIYARPDALSFVSPQPNKPHSWALRTGITPTVVNIFVFLIPVIQIVSVVIPAVLAQKRYSQAFDHYHRWAVTIQPGQTLSRELLVEAQQIWFKVLDAAYYISICMAVWEAWVCGLFICYCLAGGSLIATLRCQLRTVKSLRQNQELSESSAVQNGKHPRGPSTNAVANIMISHPALQCDTDEEKLPVNPTSPNLLEVQAPPRSLSLSSAVSDSATLVACESGVKRYARHTKSANAKLASAARRFGSDGIIGNTEAQQTESMYFSREELRVDEPSHSFFPPVRPSAFVRPAMPSSNQPSRGDKQTTFPSHKRYLEKFYRNFVVQFVGLMLCILFFAVFCGKLVTTWYSAWEANDLATAFEIALLVVCWVTVALASIIIFAILSRTYEPVLSNFNAAATANRSSGGSRRGSMVHGKNGPKLAARRLSGAKTWAASTLSQFSSGEHRRSQGDIGLDAVCSRRAGSLSGAGRSSMHAYDELEGEMNESPRMELDPPVPKSQPLTLRKPTSNATPDLQAWSRRTVSHTEQQPRRQRSFGRGSISHSACNMSGVMVEQTVSTIVEDPTVEEYYRIERPVRAAARVRTSPSKSDVSEQEIFTPHSASMEKGLYTPSRFSNRSEWANSPATPVTLWSPSTPGSIRPLISKRDRQFSDSSSTLPQIPFGREIDETTVQSSSNFWNLDRSRSNIAPGTSQVRRPSTTGTDPVGLGIGLAGASQTWTAPSVWGSGEPDPELMQEDAQMRLRMASRPNTAGDPKRSKM
ncbi:uncharacterized protein MEPE_00546 [Melanopsichium pennsylvanicum]|uniref:Uncharacterized protein n=2 Tax=Melanopsichium pennsylvanicum TaxID=63383 RepID=A0AAJ5C2S1_9BASI|nr:hypothetical protein BN887_02587 [Melanopsichium pennsylvanicum 4]SNX81841.1 uncharacterized protein MEPE_00546 [Melanopsichium pennsylvanicum]